MHECRSCDPPGCALHSKIMTCLDPQGAPLYHYVGSANFTPSAWGLVTRKGDKRVISNMELGVVLSASFFAAGGFPYPYQRPPQRYGASSVPWMQDQQLL